MKKIIVTIIVAGLKKECVYRNKKWYGKYSNKNIENI